MNWKEEAIEKLRRYDAMRLCEENLPQEICRLEEAAASMRAAGLGAIVRTSAQRSQEDALLSNMVHRQELQHQLQQARQWLSITNRALGALTPEEKLVLHRLYIYPERGAVERLCNELGAEQSTVYRKRDKALQRFTMALYGST